MHCDAEWQRWSENVADGKTCEMCAAVGKGTEGGGVRCDKMHVGLRLILPCKNLSALELPVGKISRN